MAEISISPAAFRVELLRVLNSKEGYAVSERNNDLIISSAGHPFLHAYLERLRRNNAMPLERLNSTRGRNNGNIKSAGAAETSTRTRFSGGPVPRCCTSSSPGTLV